MLKNMYWNVVYWGLTVLQTEAWKGDSTLDSLIACYVSHWLLS